MIPASWRGALRRPAAQVRRDTLAHDPHPWPVRARDHGQYATDHGYPRRRIDARRQRPGQTVVLAPGQQMPDVDTGDDRPQRVGVHLQHDTGGDSHMPQIGEQPVADVEQ